MDPADYLTFPQFNNALFKNHYMPKQSLGLLPRQGFQLDNNIKSQDCFAWLNCFKADLRAQGLEVVEERSGRKGFEIRICGAKVDGFFKDSSGQIHILQFHGCYWHGCTCQKKQDKEWARRRQETLELSERLKNLSINPASPYGPFVYHEMWGCQFKEWSQQMNHTQRIRRFNAGWREDVLKPRDAFFGGRTNCIKHRLETKPNEKIKYLDFTSLYPAVQYGTDQQLWPIGHPKVYFGSEVGEEGPKLEDSFGLWRVKVHPPKSLRHPVLPVRINQKLLFPLCRTCSEKTHQGPCPHSPEERAFEGTWFTEELKKAKQMGYELEMPSEIWDWPPEQRSEDLFRKMIKDQYKKKAISSPYKTESKLQKAMEELERMGIQVSREEFKPNPSMRALAKFSLNNIWGYLGKKEDKATTEFISPSAEFYKIEEDPEKELLYVDPIKDNLAMVQWKPIKEKAGKNGNIVDSLITTAYGRLKLYKILQDYPEQVAYFDTDSVFLLLPDGMEGPRTSTLLGDLKDEIEDEFGEGYRIICFYSSGPKSYTYTVVDPKGQVVKKELKLKGIQLSSQASEVVNPETIQTLTTNPSQVFKVPQWQIARDMKNRRLFNRTCNKRFTFTSSKRWFVPDSETCDTLPFGYCYSPLDDLLYAMQLALDD